MSDAAAIRPLIACAAALYTAVIGFRVTVALAAVHLGLSPASIGLVLATFALVPMLLAVRGGQLIDRVGVRRPMLVGAALCAVGALGCAALLHPAMLALSAGLVGVGMMGFHLGMQHAAGEIGGDTRRTANFNLLTMSFSVSGLLGPPMVGLIIDTAGYRQAFALSAALLGATWLAASRYPFERHLPRHGAEPAVAPEPPGPLEPPKATPLPPDADAAAAAVEAPRGASAAFSLLGAPRLRRLLLASLLASASWDVYQFVLPLHAGSIGLSASSVGLSIAAFSAGSLSVRLMLPRLLAHMHPARWMQAALAVCVLAYAAAPFAGTLGTLVALSFLIGIGPGIAQPLLMAALHAASPPGRAGEAAGLRMTLLSAMQLLVPVGFGLAAGLLGTAPLFWLYAGTAAAIGIVLARAERR
ncbi:MAG: MFS transporter [Burkholderiales bacterium]|nr:MAG: MFS transporter [Burkholderiales bacterium]